MRSLIVLFLMSVALHAIVTVKPVDVLEEANGLSGSLTASYSINEGNTQLRTGDIGGMIQYDLNNSVIFVKGNYKRGDAQNKITIDQGFIHSRFIYKVHSFIDAETFVQEQVNVFLKLLSRTLVGTGGRFNIGEATNYGKGYLGLGAFYDAELVDGNIFQSFYRANIYLSYKFNYEKMLNMAVVSYYQPRLDDLEDFLLLSTAELEIKIHERLALLISATFNYDSRPVLGVKSYDLSQSTALKFDF